MRRASLHLPILISLGVIAAVVLMRTSDTVAGLLLMAGAAAAIGVFDVLTRRGGRSTDRTAAPDDPNAPDAPRRR